MSHFLKLSLVASCTFLAIGTSTDGIISQQEHVDGSKAKFTQMDNDKNGFVTLDEMTAAHSKIKR